MSVSISPNSAPAKHWRRLKVGGVTPFTATDYPGKLASVVFVQGCPWRCGYCHNPHLQPRTPASPLDWEQVLTLLKRRVGLTDAVVFSGGEPCMDAELGSAIREVRGLGFLVGLHTGGAYPERFASILPQLDWVGLDIKAPFAQYERITGIADSGKAAQRSADLLIASGIAYEMRTTIHPAQLGEDEIGELAQSLAQMGVRNYALQVFRAQGCADAALQHAALAAYPGQALLDKMAALFPQFTLRRA